MELFKNTTIYTNKIYKQFTDFHTKEYRFSYQLYTAIVCVSLLFCFILQVIYHYYTLAICLATILTFFFLWRFFHPISSIKKESNSDKYKSENKYTFIFYTKSMEVVSLDTIVKISYCNLYKIFETNDFFYFYVDKKHAFLISKSGFEKSSSLDFSNFVQKECKMIYKNRIK